MKKKLILTCSVLCFLVLLGCACIFFSNRIFLSGKVLNENTFEIKCFQILGYKYKFDTIMTGPKCKVEVKSEDGAWILINDKEYIYLEYQSEIIENTVTSWIIHVPENSNLDTNCKYRITQEFAVFPKEKKGKYKIINKVFYVS